MRRKLISVRRILGITICIAWAAFLPPARAQWICHVVNENGGAEAGPGSPFYGTYVYTALSCKGNNAIAAADVDANVAPFGFYLAFLLSNDGGETWRIENEGLPSGLSFQPIIRKIEQIDSLHIIAFGDTNLLVRSSDGGTSWQVLTSPTSDSITDISFSDSLHGMLVIADTIGTYITSDGGFDWVPSSFARPFGWQCHDYGNGKYRLFTNYTGIVYTTIDYGNTVDSTSPIVSDTIQEIYYPFAWCSFGQGDTIFAYGGHRNSEGWLFPAIAKSTDGGAAWSLVLNDTTPRNGHAEGAAYALSDISQDTIIAGLIYNVNASFWSTDRGETWSFDSLILNDSTVPEIGQTFGVGLNSEGELLAAISVSGGLGPALIMGIQASAAVNEPIPEGLSLELFPNPAANKIQITSSEGNFSILDPLGRSYAVPRNGNTLDISSLPSGVYFVSDGVSRAKFVKE